MGTANQFSGRRYINLESYKKDGTSVMTPVQFIEENGLIYFRTDPGTWKVKRIRRNPHVRIVPSNRSGKPTGVWVDGEARELEGEVEKNHARKLFEKENGTVGNAMVNFVGRLRGERLSTIISIRLKPQETR
ncbi:MAG TPA: PPOX class F420-dependent oxidoreductase [Nitrososphaerales archaeon]|nr:PPOX class F420-dependent oxidoreductase [Nitrososphaerales archaeon]